MATQTVQSDRLAELLPTMVLSPSPNGDLPVVVRCYTAPGSQRYERHNIVLRADWTADVPHDVDAERVVAALGGAAISCVDLLDRDLPAVHAWVKRQLRLELPLLERNRIGGWSSVELSDGCCASSKPSFRSAADAAEHHRTVKHVVGLFGAAPMHVDRIIDAVVGAHRWWEALPHPVAAFARARRCVEPASGIGALWAAGLHPELVEAVHSRAMPSGRPLRVAFFLGVLTRRPDLDALARVAHGLEDPNILDWLAWNLTAAAAGGPTCREWLGMGASRQTIELLQPSGYQPADAVLLGTVCRRGSSRGAAILVSWVRAGCRPTVHDLLRVYGEARVSPDREVSAAAIERLRTLLHAEGISRTTTELGLLLAVAGTVFDAAAWIRAGYTDLVLVSQLMTDGYTAAGLAKAR